MRDYNNRRVFEATLSTDAKATASVRVHAIFACRGHAHKGTIGHLKSPVDRFFAGYCLQDSVSRKYIHNYLKWPEIESCVKLRIGLGDLNIKN